MQPFTAELARTKLAPQPAPLAIGAYRYQADPAAARVTEDGPDGKKVYSIVHTLGGKNVFYFLTPLERGRLQVLPVSYDVNRKQWFDTAGSAVRHFGGTAPDTPLSWKDPAYTFNTSCYNCHVSQLARNYDPKTDTYRTEWGEPGINCETCHGPSAEHVRAARAIPPGQPMKDVKLIVTKTMTPDQTNAMCASCHAKLSPLTAEFTPGARFFDHFALTTLEDPDFYPDGRDLGENFTETTWRLSPCLKSGRLDCVDCHTSSGRYKFRQGEPNAVCLPCHTTQVNAIAEHSHHPADSAGARCISCHMPMTEFGRMRRSDHSMRPPAPSATLAFGSPNACNICHTDKDAKWADGHVRQWHKKDYQAPILHRGGMIAAARKGDWTKLPDMVNYLLDANREEIWSASLLRLLRGCPDDAKWPAVQACLKDRSPLVRAAAVETLGDVPQLGAMESLLAATRDEFRLVRTRAAATLAASRDALNDADRRSLEAATSEYLASLQTRPDDWASHYYLGNFYMERQDPARAVEAYSAAVHFQPQGLPPLVNRALAHATLGQNDQAEASLRQALALDPTNAAAALNLALLLAELGRLPEAEQAFRTALKSDPQSAVAAYNLGVLLAKDRPAESLEWCRKAAALRPQEHRYAYTLAFFLNQGGQGGEAIQVLQSLLQRPVDSAEAYSLLGMIYERQGKPAEAAEVYRRAAENGLLPEAERTQFLWRTRALAQTAK
jgi:tetratricopeptide (TPR) repeat protein